jgi:heme-degrading monooxygenase HmoA
MIARIGLFRDLAPEAVAESRRNLVERFRPALMAQEGFVAGHWLVGADGTRLSVTVWASDAALRTGGARANATPLLAGQDPARIPSADVVELYEVVAHVPSPPAEDEPRLFARVFTHRVTPAQVEQTVGTTRARDIPALQQLADFRGGYWLVDRTTGTGVTLTLWASEAALHAGAEATERLGERGVQAANVEAFEVEERA